jgi:endonuclease YncB( thermonuclease family)
MEGGMARARRLLVGVFVTCLVAGLIDVGAASPRYKRLGRAEVVKVDSSNLMHLRLLDRDRTVSVRLLGVGSPRNRERIKDLNDHCLDYIRKNHLWEVSRNYVKALVERKVVEVWGRKWNPLDDKNRLLVYLMVPDFAGEPLDLNAAIIEKGLGFVTRDYVHVTFARYKLLEKEAKRSRRGIWRGLSLVRTSSLAR